MQHLRTNCRTCRFGIWETYGVQVAPGVTPCVKHPSTLRLYYALLMKLVYLIRTAAVLRPGYMSTAAPTVATGRTRPPTFTPHSPTPHPTPAHAPCSSASATAETPARVSAHPMPAVRLALPPALPRPAAWPHPSSCQPRRCPASTCLQKPLPKRRRGLVVLVWEGMRGQSTVSGTLRLPHRLALPQQGPGPCPSLRVLRSALRPRKEESSASKLVLSEENRAWQQEGGRGERGGG